jgi:type III secretion protein D
MLSAAASTNTGRALRPVEGSPLLAVVAGPRAGARRPLVAGQRLSIGFDLDCDVVIRHPSLQGIRASLSIEGEDVRLHIDRGQANLLGLAVPEGRSIVLPRWVPVALGDAMIAVGSDQERGWASCRRLARQLAEERAIEPGEGFPPEGDDADQSPVIDARRGLAAAPGLAGVDQSASSALSADWRRASGGVSTAAVAAGRRLVWQVPAAAAACLVLAIAVGMLSPKVRAIAGGDTRAAVPASEAADRVRVALADLGLTSLRIERMSDGTPVVRGLVDTDAQRARISGEVARLGVRAFVEVVSAEQLVRQVADVLRVKGLPGSVRHLGRGVIEAQVGEADAERARRTEEAVRRDVAGLTGFRLQFTPKTQAAPVAAPKAPEDPAKRVVSVAYGPNGHVVTADGARYFVGALLPSGHRIVRIADGEVELSRDGQTTRLSL